MSEKHQKVKVISFNTNNHLEKFLYDSAHAMKGNQSFAGLMKQLFVAYLTSTGTPPPGTFDISKVDTTPKRERTKRGKTSSKPKMGGGAFFYDEEE